MDLTPRSKVRAMLAAFDDDSDKENESRSPVKPSDSERMEPFVYGSGSMRRKDAIEGYTDKNSHLKDAEWMREDGKAVHLQRTDETPLGEDQDSILDDNAYERVKRQLIAQEATHSVEREEKYASLFNETVVPSNGFNGRTDEDSEQVPQKPRVVKRRSHASRSTSRDISPQNAVTPRHQSPPGLFVSPDDKSTDGRLQHRVVGRDTDSDLDMRAAPTIGNRLKDLVARKRRHRLAKENDARRSPEDGETSSPRSRHSTKRDRRITIIDESESNDDREAGKKLTQQARPTRKASKKALEDMHRETQRISRNMQLAHEAKTKTKFTKEAFLAKFNYRHSTPVESAAQLEQGTSSSTAAASDAEHGPAKETPPSSPPTVKSPSQKIPAGQCHSEPGELHSVDMSDDDSLPDVAATLACLGREARQSKPVQEVNGGKHFSVRQFAKSKVQQRNSADSDEDLEIVSANKASRLLVFDRIPLSKPKQSNSLHTLRALAHLYESDQPRSKARQSMSATELQISLQRRAREQAQRERDEKIQKLKDKGIVVLSAEEKEKDQLQLENMLEKARREADELAKREKEAARKEGREIHPDDQLPDSDDEDEDWDGREADGGVELSGSEDEDDEQAARSCHTSEVEEEEEGGDEEDEELEDDDEELGDAPTEEQDGISNPFVDNEASDDSDGGEKSAAGSEDELEAHELAPSRWKISRRKVVLTDDEDDLENEGQLGLNPYSNTDNLVSEQSLSDAFGFPQAQSAIPTLSQVFGGTMADSASDAFGFKRDSHQPAVPGLSQLFAGTMADTQTRRPGDIVAFDSQQDSMEFLRGLPPPDLPDFGGQFSYDSQSQIVQDSQAYNPQNEGSGLVRFDTQTQLQYPDTQVSEMPNPTPDVGFQTVQSPSPLPPASFSTVDTVLLPPSEEDNPLLLRRKRRLMRRTQMPLASGEIDDSAVSDADAQIDLPGTSVNAFDVMRSAASKPAIADSFDKKRSEAKGMVEEQAAESEDEYAGLGGASDDDSQGDLDEETKNMIDDVTNEKVNEGDIAAFYADKERMADEKQVERIYRDIANGGLRRKRGADIDLFDSDNEDEAAARRRAAKQREFARMRKALLADEKLGKIAENPKQQAFLRAIEDREDADELNILDQPAEAVSQITDSQSDDVVIEQSQQAVPLMAANVGKRRFSQLVSDGNVSRRADRLPPSLRRTNILTRPTSIAEIRNTLSEVFGEPDIIAETQLTLSPDHSTAEQDDEVEDLPDGHDTHRTMHHETVPLVANHRRSTIDPTRAAVIDRMALKRTASSFNNSSHTPNDRLAFQAPAKASSSAFRKPSLLRRATTAGSNTTTTSASSESMAERGGMGKESVKMGGTKKSSVNYYVREKERTSRLEEVEKERMDGRERLGRMRRNGTGLGALVGGSFH